MNNPQAAINQMILNNPKYQQINKMIEQADGDAEKAFKQKCSEMGVNPSDIINQLKSLM